jgi:hypothetical protein
MNCVQFAAFVNLRFNTPRSVLCPRLCFLVIVAVVRNEVPYLAEWLEFLLLVGVNMFFIINNRSEDNLTDVLSPYIRDGVVKYSWDGRSDVQFRIYQDFLWRLRSVSK